MSLGLRLPRTKRLSLFWLVALLFLSQQVALAASLCPMPPSQIMAAASASALQSDCMDGGQAQTHPAMCAQHCAQGSVVQSDTQSPKVPGSLLPPLAPAMPAVLSLPRSESSFAAASRLRPDRPPLRLLFCSLLI
jgi:hypothetical protein